MCFKKYRFIIVFQLFLASLVFLIIGISAHKVMATEDSYEWVTFPYSAETSETYEYLYVVV
ncbi:MAG: hypothetical protein E7385_02795 [Ruminococcaceae bacterium]|jgi:hypothetical protein|nr:hypothetical protein [Oscillospiraceae bacterium]